MTAQTKQTGRVIIAGAGPGDPELITLKAWRAIHAADVIIVDRLVSDALLADVKPGVVIIHAGKQGRNSNSVPQSEINKLIVQYALKGNVVVRLKGGDVSIFSNLLDELEALVSNNIGYEIIPGITAASGAAAAAGIPLTARGHATAVRFLTYYKNDLLEDLVWKDLSSTSDTLVFYMSSSTLDNIVEKLLDHGVGADKYVAIVEQATTPSQQVEIFNVYEYDLRKKRTLASPSLIIIGSVAKLHDQFQWQHSSIQGEDFRPLKVKSQNVPYLTHH